MQITLPTILTLIRLVISPILLPTLLLVFLPIESPIINGALACIFLLLAFTDFLDGYLARKLGQVTQLGRILDPIADKFLIFPTLIALLSVHRIHIFVVLLFIGREFFVMGLRQLALERQCQLHVSWLGKAKTIAQIAYVASAIAAPANLEGHWYLSTTVLLFIAVVLTVWSAVSYYKTFMANCSLSEGASPHS